MSFVSNVLNRMQYKQVIGPKKEHLGLKRIHEGKGCIEIVRLKANTFYPSHIHDYSDVELFILSGNGLAYLNGKKREYSKGSHISVPAKISHGFRTNQETFLLSIQSQEILSKDELDLRYLDKSI